MKAPLTVACICLGLLSFKQQTQAAPRTHLIPVGDAGAGLATKLPAEFTMEQPQGSYFYFGKAIGGTAPEIWVYVFVDYKKSVSATLKQTITPIKQDSVTMLSKAVDWSRWESRNVPYRHIFHREVYLEDLARHVKDPFIAKRLEGVVVTISIGGLNESVVNAIQKCFVETELREDALPPADPKPTPRFVEALYQQPPGAFAGESYDFNSGRFVCRYFSDVGSPPPEEGSYKIDGTRLTLLFDTPKLRPFVFYYREVGAVRLLISPQSLQSFEAKRRLTSEFYISVLGANRDDRDWWQKALKQHPEFLKAISEQP